MDYLWVCRVNELLRPCCTEGIGGVKVHHTLPTYCSHDSRQMAQLHKVGVGQVCEAHELQVLEDSVPLIMMAVQEPWVVRCCGGQAAHDRERRTLWPLRRVSPKLSSLHLVRRCAWTHVQHTT